MCLRCVAFIPIHILLSIRLTLSELILSVHCFRVVSLKFLIKLQQQKNMAASSAFFPVGNPGATSSNDHSSSDCRSASMFCNVNIFRGNQNQNRDPDEAVTGDMSSLIATEMNKLSFKEREEIYEDLHAISKKEEKTKEELEVLISQVKENISLIRRNKQAYNKAAFLNPEYVESFDLLYMFLVAEKFHPGNTAQKIINHFAIKLDLFGPNRLAKKITYNDLDEDDKEALHTGSFQVLGQDTGKRTIFFHRGSLQKYKTVENQIRAMWYLFMTALEKKDIQRNGVVGLSYMVGCGKNDFHLKFHNKTSLVTRALPMNPSGFHLCYSSRILHPFISTMQLVIGGNMRLRFRSHFGSPMEVQYKLQSFGISQEVLPIQRDGFISLDYFKNYLKNEIRQEEIQSAQEFGMIFHPLTVDVLLGRGRHPQEHQGNLYLTRLVEDQKEVYKASRKNEKKPYHILLVKTVQENGGRFLKRSSSLGGGWVEVDDDVARGKVRNKFREAGSNGKANVTVSSDDGGGGQSMAAARKKQRTA